ncbi:hypothetical protein NDU88_006204 [Pleurodeles waltl]|uniref:Uncharacterized protein n=1 Tax=Pleurodeles waltl TaxID=8319 RepID=A0AAV7LZJ2_PLEWA|nr:hypothetical protein NDU88_006204 [Pleurodeles waltl]
MWERDHPARQQQVCASIYLHAISLGNHSAYGDHVFGDPREEAHPTAGPQDQWHRDGAADVCRRPASCGAQYLLTATCGPLNPARDPDRITGLLHTSRVARGNRSPPSASAPTGRQLRSRRLTAVAQASPPSGLIRAKHPSARPSEASTWSITFEAPPTVPGQLGDMRSADMDRGLLI